MSDEYTCRLTIAGPAEEIARFGRECIRVLSDEPAKPPSFDFEALVPIPSEIAAISQDCSDEVRAIARAATGHGDWWDWSTSNWGTRGNTYRFRGKLLDDTTYDCAFAAGDSPSPVIEALARRYPRLRGTFVTSGLGCEWCTVGVIQEGGYSFSEALYHPLVLLLAESHDWPAPAAEQSARALLATLTDGAQLEAPQEKGAIPAYVACTRAVLRELCRTLDGKLAAYLALACVVLDVHNNLEDQLWRKDLYGLERYDQKLDPYGGPCWAPSHEAHVAFLRGRHCFRTEVERQLTLTLVGCMRERAFRGDDDRPIILPEMWISDDRLRDWAHLTLSRPGTSFDCTDYELLREHLRVRAERLAHDIVEHLHGAESWSPVVKLFQPCQVFSFS